MILLSFRCFYIVVLVPKHSIYKRAYFLSLKFNIVSEPHLALQGLNTHLLQSHKCCAEFHTSTRLEVSLLYSRDLLERKSRIPHI